MKFHQLRSHPAALELVREQRHAGTDLGGDLIGARPASNRNDRVGTAEIIERSRERPEKRTSFHRTASRSLSAVVVEDGRSGDIT